MPSREKKAIRNSPVAGQKRVQPGSLARGRTQPHRFFAAGNSTRINAFVTSQGRRNQAKRDAR